MNVTPVLRTFRVVRALRVALRALRANPSSSSPSNSALLLLNINGNGPHFTEKSNVAVKRVRDYRGRVFALSCDYGTGS